MTLVSTCSMAVLILSCQSLTLSPSLTRLSSTLSRTWTNVSLFKKMRLQGNLELTRSGPILPSLNLRPLSAKRAGPPVCKRCQVLRLLLLYCAWYCVGGLSITITIILFKLPIIVVNFFTIIITMKIFLCLCLFVVILIVMIVTSFSIF